MTLATDAQNSPAAMTDEVFVFPTSFAQQRLWFLDQLDPGSPAYNIPTALHIKGQLKIAVLKQSIAQLIARHESLRTTFASRAGDPLQVVHPTLKLTLPVVDLQSLPHSQQTTVLQYWINQIAQLPFDLGVGPLLRVTVIQLAPAEYIVSFTIHHIIADGLSIEILIQELALLYASFTNNYLSPLSPLSIQYADFSIWQREQLQGERLAAQLTYWQQHLQDVPPVLALPTVYPRPVTQSFRGARQSFQLSAPLTQALRHLGQQEKATLFMTLLAVFKTLLYRYSGQADILVGSPIANRNRPELETVIGLFANTLVLRTHVSGHLSFRQLLRQVRTIALDAYAHQDLPFEQLVDSLKLERTLNHNPLFQVMFILQNATAKQLELPELTLSNLEITNHIARFDLTLLINDTGSELVGAWEYSTDLFDAPFMKRMAEHFQILLEAIVTAPDQPITDLPLLTPTEQQRLISWNQTQTEFQSPPCLHHLFETQATLIPDAIALVYENQQLTYAYLNQQAHRLAQQLQALGVGPDTPVGVCLERTPQLLITLLGILKAGGAYLPLDPSYPTDRLNFMLADSQAPLLLTQTILTERFPDYQGQIICLDATGNEEQTQNLDSEEPEFRSQNSRLKTQNSSKFSLSSLAYIIYTSGSTGRPKGVQIPHQAVVNFLHS
ncbi:MAG: condensation domain-containing protein, partial [Cyanobacteria bacterium P01_H01_bin.121]